MNFRITNDGNRQDINEIRDMLKAYNQSCGITDDSTPIGVFYEDEYGKKLAGLTGVAYGNWFSIDFLFVSETLRGQGIGKRILLSAEAEAKAKGCKYAFLNTNAFQAPWLYEKMGYQCVFSQKEFPIDGEKFYYTKVL